MIFGQIVIGPPGSGKTTYCKTIMSLMKSLGRKVVIVNLDPGNEHLPYKSFADINELITDLDAMSFEQLGPNGGLIYCMEYLEKNISWLLEKMSSLTPKHYVLFDCPGQIELYTIHNSVRNIVKSLTTDNKFSLCAVHLVDSLLCSKPTFFVSALMVSLSTMLKIELPHINVLTKIDLIEKRGPLHFNLDFYTEVLDLDNLLRCIEDDPRRKNIKELCRKTIDLVNDYGLVYFVPMHIEDKESLLSVLNHVDKANGYLYGTDKERVANLFANKINIELRDKVTSSLQEKFIDSSTNFSEE